VASVLAASQGYRFNPGLDDNRALRDNVDLCIVKNKRIRRVEIDDRRATRRRCAANFNQEG